MNKLSIKLILFYDHSIGSPKESLLQLLLLLKDNFDKTEFHYKETLRILNKDEFI